VTADEINKLKQETRQAFLDYQNLEFFLINIKEKTERAKKEWHAKRDLWIDQKKHHD